MSFNAEVGAEGEGEFAAKYVVEDAGQAEARWKLYPDVLDKDRSLMPQGNSLLSATFFCEGLQCVTVNIK